MGTVFTTTQANMLPHPGVPAVSYEPSTGNLYMLGRTATDTLGLYLSTNNGGSWSLADSFTTTGLQEWSGIVLDDWGLGHMFYRVGTGSADTLLYRRIDMVNDLFGGPVTAASDSNGGTIGSRMQGMDFAAVQKSSTTTYLAWAVGYGDGAGRYGLKVGALTLTMPSGYLTVSSTQLMSGNRYWLTTGSLSSNRVAPYMEFEHTGNGYSASSTPNLWIGYGRSRLSLVRMAWNGNGWTGPSSATTIRSSMNNMDYSVARWDGTQFLQCIPDPAATSTALVYQRNRSNSTTVVLPGTPAHPTGAIRHLAVTYDRATKDVRVYAIGTSTDVLYFCTYSRSLGTWAAWATVTATAILGASTTAGAEFGTRRGGTYGNAKYDVVTAHSGAPNTVVSAQQSITSAPSTPTWDTSAVPYVNGGAADVGAALTLDWTFFDVDPGASQGSYALSRQIGAGALSYWNAGTVSWGATEVQNSTATTQATLPTAWGSDTDAAHTYRVKVWDNTNTPSANYSAQLQLIPSTKSNPTITAPTNAQVIATDQVTATWTVADQASRRIRLLTSPGGVVTFDSGYMTTTDLTYTVPTKLANGSAWTLELTTRNAEGLASNVATRAFSVAYSSPPAPTSTQTPLTGLGVMRVQAVQLAAVGTQPSTTQLSLYRRRAITPVRNTNSSFAGNVTGWTANNGTLSYSTSQFIDAPGAARLVPGGVGAFANIEMTPNATYLWPITAGATYYACGWIRPDTANKGLRLQLNWFTSADVFISNVPVRLTTPVAGAWHFMEVVANPQAVATAAKASVTFGLEGTPLATDAFYADKVELREYNADTGTRVAEGEPAGSIVDDFGAASLTEYEYRWLATGSNGTSVYGPWQT